MEPRTTHGRASDLMASPGRSWKARFPGKYLSLPSFTRGGTGVATPGWFVIENGRLLVHADPESLLSFLTGAYEV